MYWPITENEVMNSISRFEAKRKGSVLRQAVVLLWAVGFVVMAGDVRDAAAAPAKDESIGQTIYTSCCYPGTNVCTPFTLYYPYPLACAGQQANGELCLGISACNLPDGSCIEIDARCCDDAGGTVGDLTCPRSCCLLGGICDELSVGACVAAGGLPGDAGTDCSDPMATCGTRPCCVPTSHNVSGCENLDPADCAQHDGTDLGLGHGVLCVSLLDVDGDGVRDNCDNCVNYNPNQEDDDSDGHPDACDNCSPSDLYHDCIGTACSNPGQEDCDENEIGDICDPDFMDCDGDGADDCCDDDSDGDGVNDVDDACPFNHPLAHTDAAGRPLGDFDGDCDVDSDDEIIFDENLSLSPGCEDTSASCAPPAP